MIYEVVGKSFNNGSSITILKACILMKAQSEIMLVKSRSPNLNTFRSEEFPFEKHHNVIYYLGLLSDNT